MKATPRILLALTVLMTMCAPIQAAQKVDLRFRPTPANKQTLRVTSTLDMSM